MSYTKILDTRVDSKIDYDMKIVCDEILKIVRPISIILFGGFGRGEGSVLIKNNKIFPMNDYDIFIVQDRKIDADKIKELVDKIHLRLNKGIDTLPDFNVSIMQIKKSELLNLPDIKAYDIKMGGKILYGEDVRKEIDITIDDVPLFSGSRLLFQKMIGLSMLFSTDYLHDPPNGHRKVSVAYECGRTYMEIGTALSLVLGFYKSTYSGRNEVIMGNFDSWLELSSMTPDLGRKIDYFTNLKLFPNEHVYECIDIVKLWLDARSDLGIILRYYMYNYLGIKTKDGEWKEFSDSCYKKMKKIEFSGIIRYYLKKRFKIGNEYVVEIMNFAYQKYFSLMYMLKLYKERKVLLLNVMNESPICRFLTSAPLLLYSMGNDGVLDKSLFGEFIASMGSIYPINIDDSMSDKEKWEIATTATTEIYKIILEILYKS